MELRFQGQPVSSGIAMGRLRVEARGCSAPLIRTILPTEIEAEWQRFETALERTELEIKVLKTRVEELSGANEAAIFDAHLLFLRDRMIISRLRKEMPKRLQNIDSVYYAVVQNFMEAMRQVDDAYLRSRVTDIADVLQRVLKNQHAVVAIQYGRHPHPGLAHQIRHTHHRGQPQRTGQNGRMRNSRAHLRDKAQHILRIQVSSVTGSQVIGCQKTGFLAHRPVAAGSGAPQVQVLQHTLQHV